MNKLTKIGLNAMVAIALMFATTVVVAQEKVVASDGVEVKESVEAKIPHGGMSTLNSEFAANNLVTKASNSFQQQWYVLKDNVAATRENALDASNYELHGPTQPCGAGNTFCGVFADDDGGLPDISSVSTDIETYFDGLGQSANISAEP